MSKAAHDRIAAGLNDAIAIAEGDGARGEIVAGMSLIEIAAREMCRNDMLDPDSSLSGDGQNFLWMEYAETKVKPMLRTLREPTQAMIEAGVIETPWPLVDGQHIVRHSWIAMIDAAINEAP